MHSTEHLPELTREEQRRYRRHLVLPEVGREGQQKLKASSVLMIGAGGLGSPLGLYLAAAGVGTIGIVDFDVVDETNLQRQILHGTKDVGRTKVSSARDRIADVNPNVEVVAHEVRLDRRNAVEIFRDYDVIADGTDNFATRYLVNDACVLAGKPNVHGSIFRFDGQATVFWPPEGPCYRCMYPEPPPPGMVPSCAEGGVLGVLPGIIGVVQALETVKILLGIGDPLVGRLLSFEALGMSFREFRVHKDPGCPLCGPKATITTLQDYDQLCGLLPLQDGSREIDLITAVEVHQRLANGSRPFLLDVREPHELADELGHIDGVYLIPLHSLPERIEELQALRDREIVVVCASGWRSAMATRFLVERGFARVANMTGGMIDWHEEGLPFLRAADGGTTLLARLDLDLHVAADGNGHAPDPSEPAEDGGRTAVAEDGAEPAGDSTTLDIRGLICPYTLIETRDALKAVAPGRSLVVLSDYAPAATETIPNFAAKKGYPIEVREDGDGSWRITITRTE